MSKKTLYQRKRLAAIFASFAILIMGSVSLIQNMSIDYYSVLGTLQKVLPASIIIGGLGWVMGMILDKPKKRAITKYNNLYLKTLANENFVKNTEKEETEVTPETGTTD